MELTDDQKAAAKAYLKFLLNPNQKEFVLEGYSGCGKTFLTKHLIELTRQQTKMMNYLHDSTGNINIALTAFTHKAAQALHEKTGEPVSTIHSFLKLRLFNNYKTGEVQLRKAKDYVVQENTVLFIDEASMADKMMCKMIRESTYKCKVVLIGDPKQILAVFATEAPVFNDYENGALLQHVVRQAADNPTIQLATELRQALDGGPMPRLEDFYCDQIQPVDGPQFQSLVNSKMGPGVYRPDDTKILCWTNNAVHEYNSYVRGLHYSDPELQIGETLITNSVVAISDSQILLPAESVCVITRKRPATEYGIEGHWVEIQDSLDSFFIPDDFRAASQRIKQAKKEQNWYEFFEMQRLFADVRPPYASTVHKSQGSTYQEAFLDLDDIGQNTRKEELIRILYVAVTRAAQRVYLYGELPKRLYS